MNENNPWKPVADDIGAAMADAARWRFVRDNLSWTNLMHNWGFEFVRGQKDETLDQVIDRLIAEQSD